MTDAPHSPPHDILAERSVLGAMVINPDVLEQGCREMELDDFYRLAHQTIWTALRDVFDEHGTADLVMLRDQLRGMGKLEEVGGVRYLAECMADCPSSWNYLHYGDILKRMTALRRLGQVTDLVGAVHDGTDLGALIAKVRGHIERVEPNACAVPHVAHWLDEADAWASQRPEDRPPMVGLGLPRWDRRYGAFEPGELVVLMAFSSVGKTALLSQALITNSVARGIPTLFFSAEVAGRTLAIDWLRYEARVDWWDIRDGNMLEDQFTDWHTASQTLRKAPLYVDATPRIAIEDLLSRAMGAVRRHGIRLIAVDYLQLLRTRGGTRESFSLQVAHMGVELKRLAREANVPVIVLSQETMTESGKRRTRYAEEVEHAADWVLCLERDAADQRAPEDEDDIARRKLCVTKSRHRGTSYMWLTFNKPILTFEEAQ